MSIARELGADDRVVAVVQYLRVALITASMPIIVTLVYHAEKSGQSSPPAESGSAPWYVSIGMLIVIVLVGATAGRWIRLPGAGLLGPMALTIALELTGFVVRTFRAHRPGSARLRRDRLAGRRRVHPRVRARDRTRTCLPRWD